MRITFPRILSGLTMATWMGLTAIMSSVTPSSADIAIKDGQKLGFMGDSITAGGWSSPGGYVRLVLAGLEANGVKVTPIPAGIGGHKSNQMLERLKRDVLDKNPDWMTLSCGVNDVWHGEKGIPLDQYKTNMTAIIDQCQAAKVKVVILTATVIFEDLDNDNNKKLAAYNDFLRQLAKEKNCPLADLNAMFQEAIKNRPATTGKPGWLLTSDGVHMNPAGDQLMAKGVLQAFGLDTAQMKKAQEAWLDLPGAGSVRARFDAGKNQRFEVTRPLTMRQREKLEAAAGKEGKKLNDILNTALAEDVKSLVKPAGEYESAAAIFEAKKEKEAQKALQEKFNKRIESMLNN